MAGSRSLFWLTAMTHFMPTRSAAPVGSPPGRYAGIACPNDPAGRGMHDLRRQLGVARQPAQDGLRERGRSGNAGIGGDVRAREVAERGQIGHRAPLAPGV